MAYDTLIDRQTDIITEKHTHYKWAGGTFFPVVLLCQFFVLAGNRFWFYILLMYLEYHTVVVLCLFFWFWWEIVFGVTYVLSVQYSCAVVSVFCCVGKINFVQIFLLNPNFLLVHSCSIQIFFSYIGIGIRGDGQRTENSTWTPWFSFLHENSMCFHNKVGLVRSGASCTRLL